MRAILLVPVDNLTLLSEATAAKALEKVKDAFEQTTDGTTDAGKDAAYCTQGKKTTNCNEGDGPTWEISSVIVFTVAMITRPALTLKIGVALNIPAFASNSKV